MIRLTLASVGLVEESGSVVLVLQAEESERMLIMEIGFLEGRAIALAAEGVEAPRPLTHDLLFETIKSLGAELLEIRIQDYKEQTFYATIVLRQAADLLVELDARPSDAIALALRAGVPIRVTPEVLSAAGVEAVAGEEAEEGSGEEDEEQDPEIVH
jgi:bifunctional DNase/RNase